MLLAWKRLAKDTEIVLTDEIVDTLCDNIVHSINKSCLAIHLLYERHRDHTLSEASDFSFLPVLVESLLPAV